MAYITAGTNEPFGNLVVVSALAWVVRLIFFLDFLTFKGVMCLFVARTSSAITFKTRLSPGIEVASKDEGFSFYNGKHLAELS